MTKPINADQAAKLVVQNSQPVISSVPKPPAGPTAAEQTAAQPPFTVTLNKPTGAGK